MKIIAIETSCDETSIAFLEGKKIIDCLTWTQIPIFKYFGGVIPQISSQLHSMKLPLLLEKIINKNKINWNEIKLIAYTKKPGLIGCLKIGEALAKSIALYQNIPIMPIDHLHGHIYAGQIENEIMFPALGLVVSGGHTQIIYLANNYQFKVIGTTLDDAIGEAIDKIGRKLKLNYPAGPEIEKMAINGKKTYNFSIYNDSNNYNFSFSGLKTHAINTIKKKGLENINKNDFAFSLQNDIFTNLKKKLKLALKEYKVENIVVGGGVATNDLLKKIIKSLPVKVIIPSKKYCTDNAAMIGVAAFYQSKKLKIIN